MIDQIIDFNKTFVAQKGYEKYVTDKYPDKKLAVLTCMDTRLTELLPAALGLKNGEGVLVFYVCGHLFAFFDCNDYHVISLKCQPERIDEIIVPSRLRTEGAVRLYRQSLQ